MRLVRLRLGTVLSASFLALACDAAGPDAPPPSGFIDCVGPIDSAVPPVCNDVAAVTPRFERSGIFDFAVDSTFGPEEPQGVPVISFDLTVLDERGTSVLTAAGLRTDVFGSPSVGQLSVATSCDASAPRHDIELRVAEVFERAPSGSTQPSDRWDAACLSGCRQQVNCIEDEATLVSVVFSFTAR
jgi:hypothetical protein